MTAADPSAPLSDDEVLSVLSPYKELKKNALALSGGPDSMALCHALSRSGLFDIHAITVDHGLRANSADEAAHVHAWVKDWPRVTHAIVRWDGDKPDARVMEEARRARYALMADYCKKHGISHLFVAHHRDDQAETFLIRLAAGSGLDGLAGMRGEQIMDNGLTLVRPFLSFEKERLIATCHAHGISFVTDPSNVKDDYLRPRLRAARAALEEEGLSNKRLSVTAARLSRARDALDAMAAQAYESCLTAQDENATTFAMDRFRSYPAEIRLRMLLAAMDRLHPDRDYAPRMEKAEDLLLALENPDFRGRTLGGCVFALKGAGKALYVGRES